MKHSAWILAILALTMGCGPPFASVMPAYKQAPTTTDYRNQVQDPGGTSYLPGVYKLVVKQNNKGTRLDLTFPRPWERHELPQWWKDYEVAKEGCAEGLKPPLLFPPDITKQFKCGLGGHCILHLHGEDREFIVMVDSQKRQVGLLIDSKKPRFMIIGNSGISEQAWDAYINFALPQTTPTTKPLAAPGN